MNRKELLNVLGLLKPSLDLKGTIPILNHFCFLATSIVAVNCVQAASLKFETDLNCVIPGNLLYKLLSNYVSDNVELKSVVESTVQLKAGKSKVKINVLNKDCMIDIDDTFKTENSKGHFSVTEDFIKGLEKCIKIVNENTNRDALTGVTLENTKNETILWSTDGTILSRYVLFNQVGSSDNLCFEILLPKLFCQQLIIWFKEFGDFILIYGDNFVKAEFSQGYLYTKLLQGVQLLNYTKVFESFVGKKDENSVITISDSFEKIIDRSLLLTVGGGIDRIEINVKDNELICSTESDAGKIEDVLYIENSIENCKFIIDSKCLKYSLSLIKNIYLLKNPDKNDRIEQILGEDENFSYIIICRKS